MIEGSGSGSIPLTNGSGSGRPKNMWVRWIWIRNTGSYLNICRINLKKTTIFCYFVVSTKWTFGLGGSESIRTRPIWAVSYFEKYFTNVLSNKNLRLPESSFQYPVPVPYVSFFFDIGNWCLAVFVMFCLFFSWSLRQVLGAGRAQRSYKVTSILRYFRYICS